MGTFGRCGVILGRVETGIPAWIPGDPAPPAPKAEPISLADELRAMGLM
jgi:hypothetical protein